MNRELLKTNVSRLLKMWLEKKASVVNHRAVIKDIYQEVGISAGYLLMLTLANLIALSGLITNSTAVIIGAMLISPLMGPILSSGFAFITGDMRVGRRALRKITLSVVVTIVIATVATYLSPMKDITPEIMARTRPNLYDLAIAFLAGTAGAIALCTKKNVITVVPGVAIATAVIPPLSVTGFGIGTGHWAVALGGFFLFFTNFVAIVVCTCMIFFVYGFRPRMVTEADISLVKNRIAGLAALLVVISVPLVYTLVTSVAEVGLRRAVDAALKQEFNREKVSRLSTFSFTKGKKDELVISAVVNTVTYIKETDLSGREKSLADRLARPVKLNLEQVLVQAGGLKETPAAPGLISAIAPQKSPEEVIKGSRDSVLTVVRKAVSRVNVIIAPFTVTEFSVEFRDKSPVVSVGLIVRRDEPFPDEAAEWLRRIVADELHQPVILRVETIPFIPLLTFADGGTTLTEAMKNSLLEVKKAYDMEDSLSVMVESFPAGGSRAQIKQAEERGHAVAVMLRESGIPEEKIRAVVNRGKTATPPTVRVAVLGATYSPSEKAGK